MSLSFREISQLRRVISASQKVIKVAEGLIAQADRPQRGRRPKAAKINTSRQRRRGTELVRFRKQLLAERKKGTSVAELAKKYSVSTSYIYQL